MSDESLKTTTEEKNSFKIGKWTVAVKPSSEVTMEEPPATTEIPNEKEIPATRTGVSSLAETLYKNAQNIAGEQIAEQQNPRGEQRSGNDQRALEQGREFRLQQDGASSPKMTDEEFRDITRMSVDPTTKVKR